MLFRTEDPVARVPEAWADVGIPVELAVQMSHVDLDIGMCPVKSLQSLRCGNDAHELDPHAALFLDEVDGIDGIALQMSSVRFQRALSPV